MGNKQYTETDIIRGCRKGNRQSQEMLYRKYFGFGMSVCLRYTYSREDALEVLNDSFMKVFDHIDTFDEARPFKTWFRRIVVNTALDHFRMSHKYRLQVSYADADDEAAGLRDSSAPAEVELKLDVEEILSLFHRLPYVHRLCFNLYEVEGYSHDEIAGLLGISPGTSRSNLSRAKKMLRSLYISQQKNRCHEAV